MCLVQFNSFMYIIGYKFSFPFLSVDCGLCVKDNYFVEPLYKHLININRPTMAIVGLQICAYTFMYDLQVWGISCGITRIREDFSDILEKQKLWQNEKIYLFFIQKGSALFEILERPNWTSVKRTNDSRFSYRKWTKKRTRKKYSTIASFEYGSSKIFYLLLWPIHFIHNSHQHRVCFQTKQIHQQIF